jgi:hypothetical protein
MTQKDGVIYVRLDDDVVYIDENCIPRLVAYRLANPTPFLVFPTIVNNVRTSFHMQEQGIVGDWKIRNEMCDEVAWTHDDYIFDLHMKALDSIERGTLVEDFALKSEIYNDPTFERGRISINAFAIFGKDMIECNVKSDEESYLSVWRPKELGRQNARCGDAVLVHFAYHKQTVFMDRTGVLNDYLKLAPPLGFRTTLLTPPHYERGRFSDARKGNIPNRPLSMQQHARNRRPVPRSYPGRNPLQRAEQQSRGPGVKA